MPIGRYVAPKDQRSKHRNAKRTKGRKRFDQQWRKTLAVQNARKRREQGRYND